MDEHAKRLLTESTERVELVVPPSSEYLRTVRLVAADTAVRAGLDCDEIEDFRIAVDELCHLVMTSTDHFIELRFVADGERVLVEGHAPIRSGAVDRRPGELSALILAATADSFDVRSDDTVMTFSVVKHNRHVLADQR
jgi:anti-sigma regulatory factor (Ser/Thr protein kinase)